MKHILRALLSFFIVLCSSSSWAQLNQDGYDDFGNFAADPADLDEEVSKMFGRFFQSQINAGVGLFTGGFGQTQTAGFNFGFKFIFYFDRSFASELGINFSQHYGLYNTSNPTNPSLLVVIQESLRLFPLSLGLRYSFDKEMLPRGLATLNPYLVAAGELVFRNESIIGNSTVDGLDAAIQAQYSAGSSFSSQAFGLAFGAGGEFDVYKDKVYLGIDIRYHLIFWTDANQLIGNIERNGNYLTFLGTATYNY